MLDALRYEMFGSAAGLFFSPLLAGLFIGCLFVEPIRQFFSELWALRNMMLLTCALFVLFLENGSAVAPVAQAAIIDGRMVYVQSCAACHANGVAGAPRIGAREEWDGRLGQGRIELARSVLKGRGGMPPKGGNASLSDAAALAALEYILSNVK